MADLDGRKREDLEPEELHEDHEEKPEPNEQETIFVRERILNRTESRRKWIARAAGLLGGAVLFGVISCLVFVWLRPHAERWFQRGGAGDCHSDSGGGDDRGSGDVFIGSILVRDRGGY